jgi:hypothetical protein
MSENADDADRRIHERVDLWKMMFLRVGDATLMGLLQDVFNQGAKFVFDDPEQAGGLLSPGTEGIVVVDGIGEVPGTVARIEDDAAVFTFAVTERQQEEVVANIMIAQNEIDLRPES